MCRGNRFLFIIDFEYIKDSPTAYAAACIIFWIWFSEVNFIASCSMFKNALLASNQTCRHFQVLRVLA